MEKLRNAKKIKWKEAYTPRTEFLRDQFDAVVGKGSYKRWEGNEVGGPGKWYVVVSPADVHEHKRAKFFAGVRKLPDSYPAGGKYFDTIREAYEYAYDTWGSPKPQDIPAFTAGDLKGISKKISEWKEIHGEDHENKESYSHIDVFRIREAMAREAVRRSPLYFDIQRFVPILKTIDLTDPNDSDKLYQGILDLSSFKTRQAVEAALAENERNYSNDYAKTVRPDGQTFRWKKENYGLANPKEHLHVTRTKSLTDHPGNFFDLAAMICTIGREKREGCVREFLDVVGKLKDSDDARSIDRRFYRSNFEESILSAWQKYNFNVKNLSKCYDFRYYMFALYLDSEEGKSHSMNFIQFKSKLDLDKEFADKWTLKEEDYPIRMFIEYGRRNSACKYWIASPYTSHRTWDKRITITNRAFDLDEFGLCEVDYAILNGLGMKKPKVVDEAFATKGKSRLLGLGVIPDQIKTFLKTGVIKGSGIKGGPIVGVSRSPREFGFVIKQLRDKILPGHEDIVQGLISAFTGWVVFLSGSEKRLDDESFRQSAQAKANGCMYGGTKKVSDMASRESLVGLLQQESGTLFCFQKAPVGSLVDALGKLSGVNEKNSPLILSFVDKLNTLGAKSVILFDEAVRLSDESGLKGILTKEDMLFLFSDAIQNSRGLSKTYVSPVPGAITSGVGESLAVRLSKLLTGNMLITNKKILTDENGHVVVDKKGKPVKINIKEYYHDKSLDRSTLSPKQRAILQYADGKKCSKQITPAIKKFDGDFIPRVVVTRILKDQVEIIDGVPIRVFSDVEIRDFLNAYKEKTSASSFLDFKKGLEEGDITTSVFTNGDGLVMSRLTLTDYLYWKIMMNRFKYGFNLADDNPQLYEDILRTYFVPNDPRLVGAVESIGGVKFLSEGKEVTEDRNGGRLVFRGGTVKAIDLGGKLYTPSEKITTAFDSDPGKNCKQIEAVLGEFFADKENRVRYRLLSSFASKRFPTKLYHPQLVLTKSRDTEDRGLSSALKQLSSVQQKVVVEIARDMVSGLDPSAPQGGSVPATRLISDPTSGDQEMSKAQFDLTQAVRTALGMTNQFDCFRAISNAYKKFGQETGQSIPYIVKNYLRRYNQQISPSVVTAKMSASLGYNVFINKRFSDPENPAAPKSQKLVDVTSNFDVTKNATNAAIVLNSFFVQHCRRLALCDGVPEEFGVSDEELAANEKKFMINSQRLAVCHYLAMTEDNDDVQDNKISTIENVFKLASNAHSLLKIAIIENYAKRIGTPPTDYDPIISADESGEHGKVWYNMIATPGWGEKAVLITTNVLTNWIHSNVPDEASSNVTAEILSNILRCSLEQSEAILQTSISSKKEIESLSSKKLFDNGKAEALQGEAEAIIEMGNEVELQDIEIAPVEAGVIEPEDAGVLDSAKEKPGKQTVDNAITEIDAQAPGVSDLVSDKVPAVEPGKDPNVLSEADEEDTSITTETEERTVIPEIVDLSLVDENIGQADVKDPKFKVKTTGAFGKAQKGLLPQPIGQPEVQIEEPTTVAPKPDVLPPVSGPGVGLPPNKPEVAPEKTYEVTQDPVVPITTPGQSPAMKEVSPMVGRKRKKKASLLGLIRVSKTFIRRGEFKKAAAINRFVKNQLSDGISSQEVRKLAYSALSNLISVSKSLQKEGKYEEALEINQIVKSHLERLS